MLHVDELPVLTDDGGLVLLELLNQPVQASRFLHGGSLGQETRHDDAAERDTGPCRHTVSHAADSTPLGGPVRLYGGGADDVPEERCLARVSG